MKKMTLFKGKISKWSMISRISIFILMFLMYSAIEAKGKASVWRSECIDCPKSFSAYQRSIALDSLNRPHMAYGLDHLYHAYYDGMEWKYETVDSLDGVGEFASLAIDSQDCVHIVYHDGKNNALKYATNSSGSWSIVTVVSSGIAYPFSSMVLDSQGKVHISYIDDFDKYLMYATNSSGAWITTIVDKHVSVFNGFNSIALDSQDNVHISYVSYYDADLKYATNASGSWSTTVVDTNMNYDEGYNSIAIDSQDNVHISYNNWDDILTYATNSSGAWKITERIYHTGDCNSIAIDSQDNVHISHWSSSIGATYLKHTTNTSGSWVTETVDPSNVGLVSTSIVLDAQDKVHIGYYEATNKALKYATNVSGGWDVALVDSSELIGGSNAIAIDSQDNLHISYYNQYERNLKYATDSSGSWVSTVVDSLLGEMDYGTSIAIDSQNKAHISYCDYHNGALKYATNASGDWVITTLDAVGRFSSIALDSQEKVHISYYDSCLKYATNASGDWVITTVDSSVPLVGMYTSIAIDSRDHVHISYHDEVEDCLKYATNASGDWVVAIIDDSEGDVGRPTSIVIDSQNVVHISYGANQNLKYARNSSAGWVNTTIYSSGDIGYSSITVDSQNNVHVSCYDMGSGTEGLKHITNASGDWVVTSVNVNNVGRYNSIAIDSKDYIYIPYNDYANYDLKCATNNPRPVAPSDLTATVISSSQINLNWVDNSDNESVFKIERKTEEAGIYEEIDMVREDVTAYSDIELGAGVTYYYRVRASNEFGDSTYSNEASAITLAPGWEESIETISGSISQKKLAEKDKTMYEIRDNLLLNSPKGIQIKDSIYKMIGKVALYAREDSQIREQVFECMNILIDKGQKFLNGENKDSQRPDKRIRAKALQTLNLLEAKAILKGDTDFLADIQEAKDIVKELSGLKVSELKKELNINTQIQIR